MDPSEPLDTVQIPFVHRRCFKASQYRYRTFLSAFMSFIASFKPRNLRIDSTKTGFPLAFSGSWVITGGWKLPTYVGNLQVELKQVDHGHAFRLRRRDGFTWIWNGCELEDFYISYHGSTIGWVIQISQNCWIDWCWCFCFFPCKGSIGSKKQVV